MLKFKCTWLSGYGGLDGSSMNFSFNEIKDFNLDAYLGDEWERDFKMLNVGEELLVSGPDGLEEVKYERIA